MGRLEGAFLRRYGNYWFDPPFQQRSVSVVGRASRPDESSKHADIERGRFTKEEVRELAGERSQPPAERKASRWRLLCRDRNFRSSAPTCAPPKIGKSGWEANELFHRAEALKETVWEKLMPGLNTRKPVLYEK